MKKTISILILILTIKSYSQDLTNWQVGVNVNPFIFSRIASGVGSEKEFNNLPNGLGFGLTVEKNWNKSFGFKTGFEYSTQTQKYLFNCSSCDNDFQSKVKYTYYKIPLTMQYSFLISEKSFLTFNQGMQVSFLKNYQYIREDNFQRFEITNEFNSSLFYENPEYNQINYKDLNFFSQSLVGIIGSVGLKTKLSNKFNYTTSLRYEYDFTSSDKISDNYINNNGKSNNFRISLELGIQYNFAINSYRFNKKPHKI